jgi:hypothetical protein
MLVVLGGIAFVIAKGVDKVAVAVGFKESQRRLALVSGLTPVLLVLLLVGTHFAVRPYFARQEQARLKRQQSAAPQPGSQDGPFRVTRP